MLNTLVLVTTCLHLKKLRIRLPEDTCFGVYEKRDQAKKEYSIFRSSLILDLSVPTLSCDTLYSHEKQCLCPAASLERVREGFGLLGVGQKEARTKFLGIYGPYEKTLYAKHLIPFFILYL